MARCRIHTRALSTRDALGPRVRLEQGPVRNNPTRFGEDEPDPAGWDVGELRLNRGCRDSSSIGTIFSGKGLWVVAIRRELAGAGQRKVLPGLSSCAVDGLNLRRRRVSSDVLWAGSHIEFYLRSNGSTYVAMSLLRKGYTRQYVCAGWTFHCDQGSLLCCGRPERNRSKRLLLGIEVLEQQIGRGTARPPGTPPLPSRARTFLD